MASRLQTALQHTSLAENERAALFFSMDAYAKLFFAQEQVFDKYLKL
jgi:hypothetical protein